MRIVCISDTHNKHNRVRIPECDILIHSGDATGRGQSGEIVLFAKWFNRQPARHKIFVPGNHDFGFQEDPQRFRPLFQGHVLIGESVEIEGLRIFGSPWTPWFHDWAFNFPKNDSAQPSSEAEKHWKEIPDDTHILVTHGPPFGILDMTLRGEPVGCPDLHNRIQNLPHLRLHQFGHIHEDAGIVERSGVCYINASMLDLYYTMKNPAYVLDIVDGEFMLADRIWPD